MAPREPPHPRADLDDDDPTVAREIPTTPGRRPPAQTIQSISMKTPAALASGRQRRVPPEPRPAPQVQLRSIGELQSHQNAAIGGRTGNLAPPRDPSEVRLRRARSNARWAVISLVVAACVATAYWLVAR
jgi:hypothetical protein